MRMRERRAFLRGLLSRLLAERSDSEGLYIPRGEEGMRRMIRYLIEMRAAGAGDAQLEMDIRIFREKMCDERMTGERNNTLSREG